MVSLVNSVLVIGNIEQVGNGTDAQQAVEFATVSVISSRFAVSTGTRKETPGEETQDLGESHTEAVAMQVSPLRILTHNLT